MTTHADNADRNEVAPETARSADWMLWLDLEADGELSDSECQRLGWALDAEPGLQAERRAVGKLHQLLASSAAAPTVQVSPDFVSRVMDQLPEAPWQRTRVKTVAETSGQAAWQLPLAAMLALATVAAFLLSGIDSALLGTGAAVADFLATTALAGAGLLEASWRGVGWGLQSLFADSPATVAAMAGLVLGLDVLFVSLLVRRGRQPVAETSADEE